MLVVCSYYGQQQLKGLSPMHFSKALLKVSTAIAIHHIFLSVNFINYSLCQDNFVFTTYENI